MSDQQKDWDWKTQPKEAALKPGEVLTGEKAINPVLVPGLTSIIIPVYNLNYPLLHFTGNCIGSVKEHTDATKTPYEIILVDNGSPVGFSEPKDYKVDKVIKNEKNLGVSKAWNQAIRISSGEFLCFLNNDTMVFDHWLEDLQEGLNHVDLITATPMYGEPFSRAVEANKKREEFAAKPYEESLSDFRDFSCMLTSKALFANIGLFDEQFFAYHEDLDLYKRMDLAGLKYASTKRVNIFHVINGTAVNMPEIAKIMEDGKEAFAKKDYGVLPEKPIEQPKPEESEVWGEDVPSAVPEAKEYTADNPPELIRTKETGDKVFLIRDKTAYWITSPEVLSELGYNMGSAVTVNRDLFYALDYGEQITLENVSKFKK